MFEIFPSSDVLFDTFLSLVVLKTSLNYHDDEHPLRSCPWLRIHLCDFLAQLGEVQGCGWERAWAPSFNVVINDEHMLDFCHVRTSIYWNYSAVQLS